jgi:uncharacterized protein YqeY
MTLRQTIENSLKESLKNRNKVKLDAIRLIVAKLKLIDVELRTKGVADKAETPEHIFPALEKMLKERNDSIAMYQKANRQDLADKEQGEIDVIKTFLPEKLSEQEQLEIVKNVIIEIEASSMKDMGKVMNHIKAQHAGKLDMTILAKQIKESL